MQSILSSSRTQLSSIWLFVTQLILPTLLVARSSETFTKIGLCNWIHATGKDSISIRHDHCARVDNG